MKRCSIGGDYWYPPGSGVAVYREPCSAPVTHRFRSVQTMVAPDHWSYRCAQHVAWLDLSICIVEEEDR